ncbi:N,N'-diacetylbacillosaminyl-diphospho-undecaprenol alpha-1,3-N-acetylgalactosaminyltransferase [subsurface metagenome]
MKIAIVANTSWYVFNFRRNLIRSLQKDGHEIHVIAPHDDYVDKLVQMEVKKYHVLGLSQRGTNPFREIASCIRLFRLFRAIQPEVVLTFTVKCNLYTGICRRFLRFEQIANISGLGEAFDRRWLLNYIISLLYKFAMAKSKRVLFQNNEDMQTMIKGGLLLEHLCRRIPGSGVDLNTYCPTSSLRKKTPRRFFMFGRLVPKKGYDLFMKVAKEVHIKYGHRAEFWIMGMVDNSRKESKQLLGRILSLQEQGIIKYLPPSDDVVRVLRQVDVVVLPSKYNEGVPRSLLEAMACGKPIITTDWKGCRDTVDHGVNGYLINVDDCNALEHYVLKLTLASEEQLERMGRMSRRKAEAEFDENQILDAYRAEICT